MYDRNVGDRTLTFRFNPEVLKDNLLFEDLQTGSIWSQLDQKAVEGPLKGSRLTAVPALQTTWGRWRQMHPNTRVLSPRLLGLLEKPYRYAPSWTGTEGFVRGMRPRELVLALDLRHIQKAYPFRELEKAGGEIEDEFGGKTIRIVYDRTSGSALATDGEEQPLPAVTVYWANWLEFHRDTALYLARRRSLRGTLQEIDPETGVVRVANERRSESRTFSVTENTKVRGNRRVLGKDEITLADLTPGLPVEVKFIEGVKEAREIRVRR